MCLLIALSGVQPGTPLVVAANRDERLDRPAVAMSVLREERPRMLGGRDLLAGGTWLAVSEAGVVAGLTNRPAPDGRDPSLRSRGELPLALAEAADATTAAGLAQSLEPAAYNPAWLIVADRRSTFYVDLSPPATAVRELGPGVHVLENRPIDEVSRKATRIRGLLEGIERLEGEELLTRLQGILADHYVPQADGSGRPPESEAACVHTDHYGTRSSEIVLLPEDGGVAEIWYTDGKPCENEWQAAAQLWSPTQSPAGNAG
jgi:uncharacterized protein with NRDE domain